MTFKVDFDVLGIPKAQPRHQAFARVIEKPGQKPKAVARVYQKNTAEWWKAQVVQAGHDHRPDTPLAGPLEVRLLFWMPRPKRLNRKKDPDGPVWHTGKPDDDNLSKAVTDALKHAGWYRDDSQICRRTVVKMYHAKQGSPGAQVAIEELPNLSE